MSRNNKKKKAAKKSSIASKLSIKIAMYVIGAVILVLVCKNAFDFGVLVYTEEGMAEKGEGKEVVVTIPRDSTISEIASILKKNGLIESELAFQIQTFLYDAEIYSGTYTLNTEYGPEELIEAMRPSESQN